jgi:hypothetical protein
MRSRARPVLCLAAALVVAGLLSAAESEAAAPQQVDLTAYLDGTPQVGDFRIYDRSDGQTYRSDVMDVIEHAASTEIVLKVTEAGAVTQETDELRHGKEERLGSTISGDFTFELAHSKRVQSFRVTPGKPRIYKFRLKVMHLGVRVGTATLVDRSTFVGFETIDASPLGTFDNAAHMRVHRTVTIRIGTVVHQNVVTTDTWVTVALGPVRVHRVTDEFQDGDFVRTIGPFDYTFNHGTYQGVPQP